MTAARTVPVEASCPITLATNSRKTFSPPPAPPEGSGIEFHAGRFCWQYIGNRDALTSAGLVPHGVHFPGDRPDRLRCGFVAPDGRKASIRKATQGRFCLTIKPTAEEEKRRDALYDVKRAAAEAKELETKVRAKKSELPQSHEEFRKRAAEFFWMTFGMFRGAYLKDDGDGSGHAFDATTEMELTAAVNSLYWAIRNGGTVFSQALRDKPITEAWMKSARLDLPLQELLKRAAAPQQELPQGDEHA